MDTKKIAIDVLAGGSVGSAPVWFMHLQLGVAVVMMVLGLLLMYFRLSIAYKEWKDKRNANPPT